MFYNNFCLISMKTEKSTVNVWLEIGQKLVLSVNNHNKKLLTSSFGW